MSDAMPNFTPRPASSGRPQTPNTGNENIRRGGNGGASGSPRPKGKGDASTPCRNILIYGYCRYQDKGCIFKHDDPRTGDRRKLNVDSPSFTPSATTSPQKPLTAIDAPVFTPNNASGVVASMQTYQDTNGGYMAPEAPAFQPLQSTFGAMSMADGSQHSGSISSITNAQPADPFGGYPVAAINPYAHGTGTDMYFQQTAQFSQPLQYHLYAPRGPDREHLEPHQRTVQGLFISENLREELQRKNEAALQTIPNMGLPQVDFYHSLVPLDLSTQKSTAVFGYPSWIYKAQSSKDGKYYALRRIEGFRLSKEKNITSVQRWKKIINANIVSVYDAFTTTRFGDSSIVFVYDYHPLSKTLADEHFGPNARYVTGRHGSTAVPETVLWNYMVQISSALQTIHGLSLAARIIDASKIILTSKLRVRLNCCSIFDVINPDTRPLTELQQEDIHSLGRLMLCIACGSANALNTPQKSLEYVARFYSPAFKAALDYLLLLPQEGTIKHITEFVSQHIAARALDSLNSSFLANDVLESELSRELENGRLVRLLTKMGFINERPEFERDPSWSESGDRYFIKLFRDYVFHSVDENGHPFVDMAHVLACLNKLDAGADEKIMLVSRDEQNCFVVTYKEVKRAIEITFADLSKPITQPLRR